MAASQVKANSCDEAASRGSLSTYLRAFNRGDLATLNQLFAPQSEFQWYAVAPPRGRVGLVAMDRASLLSFFRARHRHLEVQKLVKFTFASTQTRPEGLVANFNGVIVRRARDLPVQRRGFKATIQCDDGATQFIVVSIGTTVR